MSEEPLLDVEKQIEHWRKSADEAWETAVDLINRDHRIQFGLFFVHLALEKILKAYIWKVKRTMPPHIHSAAGRNHFYCHCEAAFFRRSNPLLFIGDCFPSTRVSTGSR